MYNLKNIIHILFLLLFKKVACMFLDFKGTQKVTQTNTATFSS